MNHRKKILINAYAVSPTKGSEYSIGWTTINLLAEKYNVYVLYGTSGNNMGDTSEIEHLDKDGYNKNIKFIKVQANFLARNINKLNSHLGLGFFFSPAFYFYQIDVYRLAKKLHEKNHFDIIHQLNPIGFREPGFLWLLNAPFVWGPISGTYILPIALINWKNWKSAINILFRNAVKLVYLKFSLRIKKAAKRADVIMTSTKADSINIINYFEKTPYILPEHFVNNELTESSVKASPALKLIWIGSIDARKNVELLLDALLELKELNWTLDIIGEGILRSKMEKKVLTNGLETKVYFRSQIPRIQVIDLLKNANLHVMTTLSDATTSVLFEAFANQVPTISLNHCGMADVICEKCGFLVSIKVKNYKELVLEFANELKKIINKPKMLFSKRDNLFTCLDKHTAKNRILDIERYYNEAIRKFNQKKTER